MSIERLQTKQRMSQIVIHGDTVYLAGQVAGDPAADIRGQTEQVLAKIDALLAEAGSSREQILSTQIWVAHMGLFAAMNEVWDAWVPEGHAPVRACVEAHLARPELLVEMMVIAAR